MTVDLHLLDYSKSLEAVDQCVACHCQPQEIDDLCAACEVAARESDELQAEVMA